MEEEIVSTEQPTEPTVETVTPVDQVTQNYEALVKQQQAQIEQLIKQQELTNKVNQQLTKKVAQLSESQTINPEEHWVDRVLNRDFKYENPIDPKRNVDEAFGSNATTLATWWLQYNKSKGLSNDEIATKYKKMTEFLKKGRGPHEVI